MLDFPAVSAGYQSSTDRRGGQAELEGIKYELMEVVPRKNINKADYMVKFPLSHGKIPGIEIAGFRLTETVAIVSVSTPFTAGTFSIYYSDHGGSQYLAKTSNKRGLLGDGSREQEAAVLAWMSWANQELLPTLALWFLPLIPGFSDPPPYDFAAIESGKTKSLRLLETLEALLEHRTWLVGNHATLADIMVAIFVSRGLEWVLGSEWRSANKHTMEHFHRVTSLPEVGNVIPHFILIEEETPNKSPYV